MDEIETKLAEKLGLEFIGDEPLLNVILRHHRVGDLLRECLSLMQGREWIKVEENDAYKRLSEVEIKLRDGSILVGAIWQHNGDWWWDGKLFDESTVTHWREIGQLPNEGSK